MAQFLWELDPVIQKLLTSLRHKGDPEIQLYRSKVEEKKKKLTFEVDDKNDETEKGECS